MTQRASATTREVVECVIPILNVASVPASARYYVDILGFELDWEEGEPPTMASVSRDGHAIMLCQGGQGQAGTWVWIGVHDIEPLWEQYRTRGARVRQGPTHYQWAYEMQVEDLDGHVLRFGSEPQAESPSPALPDPRLLPTGPEVRLPLGSSSPSGSQAIHLCGRSMIACA